MKNILHITAHLGGGVGSVVLNWMKKDIYDNTHTIICLDKNNNKNWIDVHENCERVTIYDDCYVKNSFASFLKNSMEISDIVLLHWWNHPLLYDVMVNHRLPPCRLLLWNHANSLFPPYSMPLKLFDFVDYLVFTSPVSYECPELKKLTEKQKEKIGVIWSTVGVEDFENLGKTPHKGFNVGYVGTADFGKLHKDFIRLCSQIAIPDVRFVVACGDSQQHLIDEAIRAGIWEKFAFLGRVPRVPRVPRILSEVEVFGYPLHPRNFATCEQALGEAMIAGCVPVVLNNPPEKYIVKHMETGFVADTPEEYPSAIEYLYKNPEALKRFADNAKKFAKKQYDITAMIRKWNDLFEKAILWKKHSHDWGGLEVTLSPSELYIESLGEYSESLKKYIESKDQKIIDDASDEIKKLFDSNSMFYSKNKGSVIQYLRFFPDDGILKEWQKILLRE